MVLVQSNTLWLGDIPEGVNEAQLGEYFGQFGEIRSIKVCDINKLYIVSSNFFISFNKKLFSDKAMSFVTYTNRPAAENAKRHSEENGVVLNSRYVKVMFNLVHLFLLKMV